MPSPGAGQLDQQITIQQLTQVKDAEGGMVDNWSDFVSDVWARKNNLSGNERSATRQGGIKLEERTEFTTYFIPDVSNRMRIMHNGTSYNIRHVNNFMERNEFLIITCDTGGNHGR